MAYQYHTISKNTVIKWSIIFKTLIQRQSDLARTKTNHLQLIKKVYLKLYQHYENDQRVKETKILHHVECKEKKKKFRVLLTCKCVKSPIIIAQKVQGDFFKLVWRKKKNLVHEQKYK